MLDTPIARIMLVLVAACSATACAGAPSAWDPYGAAAVETARSSTVGSAVCPVVLSNQTDEHLDAGYAVDGVESVLGLIPAGRSLSFGVSCTPGRIEAFAVAGGGFLGPGPEYRTVARLDRARPTRMGFTVVDRVR
jgi:hypothetical protein